MHVNSMYILTLYTVRKVYMIVNVKTEEQKKEENNNIKCIHK